VSKDGEHFTHAEKKPMTKLQSRAAKIGKASIALAAVLAVTATSALAQSMSRSRYNYEYTAPSDQQHWNDRNSADFNT